MSYLRRIGYYMLHNPPPTELLLLNCLLSGIMLGVLLFGD
jgi:hypothetical protein